MTENSDVAMVEEGQTQVMEDAQSIPDADQNQLLASTDEIEETPIMPDEDIDLGYTVSIDNFSGPLDLLLYLVRRSEVDISEVSIAEIADQFIAMVQQWDDLDLEVAGEFVMMAATLLEIKARLVAPRNEEESEEEEDDIFDPHADLLNQLLAYRDCKRMAVELESLEEERIVYHARRYREDIPEADDEDSIDLENADAYALFSIWDKILSDIAGKGPRTVVYNDIPIEERVHVIEKTMQSAREGQLSWLLGTVETQIQRVGIVVALMECVRKKILEAVQHEQYGDVYLAYKEESERTRIATLPPEIPEEEGKKKKRRRGPIHLVTYQRPDNTEEDLQQEIEEVSIEDLKPETDEDRFRKELNAETNVDNILDISDHLDQRLQEHLIAEGIIEAPLEQVIADSQNAQERAAEVAEVIAEAEAIVADAAQTLEGQGETVVESKEVVEEVDGSALNAEVEDEFDDDEDEYDDDDFDDDEDD